MAPDLTPRDIFLAPDLSTETAAAFLEGYHLREGAAADLLVVNGNPAEDIDLVADRAHHRAVYKDGELVAGSPAAQARPRAS